MDPRLSVIDERMGKIERIIAVSGGKGGTGKSSVASALALLLSESGRRVGLLDLDFCGPSTHLILGIRDVSPKEEKGIVPPEVRGIRFLSIVCYTGGEPSPLRGTDISNAIIELLAITQWGRLDFLVIDMPPGMGDTVLDVMRLVKKAEFLIISTPSRAALETVKNTVCMLKEQNMPILGVIENMRHEGFSSNSTWPEEFGIPFLGGIGFDSNLEDAVGEPGKILRTGFGQDLRRIVSGPGERILPSRFLRRHKDL
jgi:ATP-binding protein involved in chromosome partitioning